MPRRRGGTTRRGWFRDRPCPSLSAARAADVRREPSYLLVLVWLLLRLWPLWQPPSSAAVGRARAIRPGGPARPTRLRQSLATHLGRQSDDVWGLVLITLGLVSALGIYADLTGPAGRALREAAADVFGVGRLLVPVALCGVGGVLVRGRPWGEEPARVAIGFGFVCVAACRPAAPAARVAGVGRAPGRAAGRRRRRSAWASAEPLRTLLAGWGAGLVLASLLGLGPARHHQDLGPRRRRRRRRRRPSPAARPCGAGCSGSGRIGDGPEVAASADRHPSNPNRVPRRARTADVEVDDDVEDDEEEDDEDDEDDADDEDEAEADEEVRDEDDVDEEEGSDVVIDLDGTARRGAARHRSRARAPRPTVWRLPPLQLLKKAKSAGDRPAPGRAGRAHARGGARRARRRDAAGRHDRRADRHPLRARARPGREGGAGDRAAQGHRLRDGVARRAHPRPDPRPVGHRRRGAQQAAPARVPRRHPGERGGAPGDASARGRARSRHRRPAGDGEPGRDAAHPHRRRHRARASRRASTRCSRRSWPAARPTRCG